MRAAVPLTWMILLALLVQGCTRPDPPTINLYLAIQSDNLDQIKRHLYHGTDINQPDRDGQLPLHVAAERGQQISARLLVDNGARVDARNRDGRTAVEVAVLDVDVPGVRGAVGGADVGGGGGHGGSGW